MERLAIALKKKIYKALAPKPEIKATSIDFGPILSKLNVGKNEPDNMKKTNNEEKMAPAWTTLGPLLILAKALEMEKVIYTESTPNVAV